MQNPFEDPNHKLEQDELDPFKDPAPKYNPFEDPVDNTKLSNPFVEQKPRLPPRPAPTALIASSSSNSLIDPTCPPPLPNRPRNIGHTSSSKSETSLLDDRFAAIKLPAYCVPNSKNSNRRPPTTQYSDLNHGSKARRLSSSVDLCMSWNQNNLKVWYLYSSELCGTLSFQETKIFCAEFVYDSNEPLIWVGLERGEILQMNSIGKIMDRKFLHHANVIHIYKYREHLFTFDEHGSLKIWQRNGQISLSNTPKAFRLSAKVSDFVSFGMYLWGVCGKSIEIYNYSGVGPLLHKRLETGMGSGNITAITSLEDLGQIYAGHDDGKITVFDARLFQKLYVVSASVYRIVDMIGVSGQIWAGLNSGKILVFEPGQEWLEIKDFCAFSASLGSLSRAENSRHILSICENGQIKIWDAFLTKDNIEKLLILRKDEFTTSSKVTVGLLTWNIDSRKPSDLDAAEDETLVFSEVFSTNSDCDIVVVGFQELVDLENVSSNYSDLV
jgi:hypothetical protein